MEFITDFIVTPGEPQIHLHRYLMVLVLFLHIPYAGMLLGSALLSVLINLFHVENPSEDFSKFAREMLDHTASAKMPALVLGILPLFSLILLSVQRFAGVNTQLLAFLSGAVVLIIVGIIFVVAYRRGFNSEHAGSLRHILPGAAGSGLLFVGYFFLLGSLTLFSHPDKWAFIDGPQDVIFTWNSIWRFAEFIMISLALAGIGILFFFFRWPGKNLDANTNYGRLVKYFAAGTALAAILLVPLLAFFFHVTSPVAAMSLQVYFVWLIVLLFLLMVSIYLVGILWSGNTRFTAHIFILFLIAILGLITGDQLAMENATKEHTLHLLEAAKTVRTEREEARELAMAKLELEPGAGKKLYEAKCTTCHEIEERLVGPPHRAVLPKYKDNLEELVSFLRKPTKKDPDYPPMPSLGLSPNEARAIAQYLLEEVIIEE
jgi:cytochrome c